MAFVRFCVLLDYESLIHVDFYSFLCYSCVAPTVCFKWNKQELVLDITPSPNRGHRISPDVVSGFPKLSALPAGSECLCLVSAIEDQSVICELKIKNTEGNEEKEFGV